MRENLTKGRIDKFPNPETGQTFLWDSTVPELGLRATPGKKSFVFQSRLNGRTLRTTIGSVTHWGIDDARTEARRLQRLVDQGIDPRKKKAEQLAKMVAEKKAETLENGRKSVTFGEAWKEYIQGQKRRPAKKKWSERHFLDHEKIVQAPGIKHKRGKGVTKAGPLWHFWDMKLHELDGGIITRWAESEAENRPARLRLAYSLLRAFLKWCDRRARGKKKPTAGLSRYCAGRRLLRPSSGIYTGPG